MTDSFDRLKTALADRYTIDRELGHGGMAVVYHARDEKLGRDVALKVLRPELAASLGSERFLREIEIAAKLTHPNTLALFDCGDADGQLYYTMPFIEGESLRDRLNREKQLSIEDALQITREVADALGHAHSLGIVHRDIKPENILFTAGHPVVSDFGIARAVSEAGIETLTETGLAVGTPAYMSPEQASGSKDVDARSDLYSLGCVFYEMLGGEAPYLGNTPQAIVAKKLSEPAPRVSVVRDNVPSAVEAALDKALSRTPADRFATAEQFVEALSREAARPETAKPRRRFGRVAAIVGVLAVVLIASGAYGAWWFLATGRPGTVFASEAMDPGDRVLLADLVNRTDDSTLVLTVEDLLRVDLSDPRLVRLVARADVREALRRKGLPRDTRLDDEELARDIAQRENAKAFITGEIGRIGDGYQLTARVIASADGAELRLEQETARNEGDVIDAVSRLGRKLRLGIGESVRSAGSRPRLSRVTTASLPALRAYSEARRIREISNARPEAIQHLNRAIKEDSAFALAYISLAVIHNNDGRLAQAKDAAAMAYRFRDHLTETEQLYVTARYEEMVASNQEAAEAAYRQMLALDPDHRLALVNLSDLLLSQRRWAEAETLAMRAVDLERVGWVKYWNAVEAQLPQRRFSAVDSTLKLMVRARGRDGIWAEIKIRVLLGLHDYDAAVVFQDSVVNAGAETSFPFLSSRVAAIHGRLAVAENGVASDPLAVCMWKALWALRLRNDREEGARQIDRWLAAVGWDTLDVVQRPYPVIIPRLAEAGRIERAKQLYAEWAAVADEHPWFRSHRDESLGAIAMAEGLLDSAATSFLRWHEAPFAGVGYRWNRGLVEAGGALDRMGNTDSAVALYERALALPSFQTFRVTPIYFRHADYWYPIVIQRLGQLHESLGHRDEAIDYYNQFIDLWKDAEPELQPQVEAAREALARLMEEPQG